MEGEMSVHPFDAATGVSAVAEHRWRARLDPAWFGDVGPHGGHVAAQLLRAITCEAAEPRLAPRTLTVHFTSRAGEGEMEIETAVERRGRTLSTISARASQGGRLVAFAVAALAEGRPGPELQDLRPPDVPPPGRLPGPSGPAP